MATELYQIILLNKLQDNVNPDDVHAAFTKRFKLKPETAQKILSAKEPVCIKKDLPIEKAVMYKQAIDDLGASCRIEKMTGDTAHPQTFLDTQGFMAKDQEPKEQDFTERRKGGDRRKNSDRRKTFRASSVQPDRRQNNRRKTE